MAGKFRKWELWTANIKYEDTEEIKQRPVLVVEKDGNIYAFCAKVTSHAERDEDGEYSIKFWQEAKLQKPSTVRLSQLYHLNEDDLIYYIGHLQQADIIGILDVLSTYKNSRIIPQ